MKTIKKYLALFRSFFFVSLIADFEYRLNVVVRMFADIMWYAAQISVFEVLFGHTNRLGGWSIEETRVFLGILFLVDSVWMLLFSENLDRFSDKVSKGDLDLLLTKPVNSQFMISLQRSSTAYLTNMVISLSWLGWSYYKFAQLHALPIWRLGLLLLLVPCSLTIIYSVRFAFSASALYLTKAENLNYVWYQVYKLGVRPDSIYPTWLRYVILSLVPVGFIASIPSQVLLGTKEIYFVGLSIILATLAIGATTLHWRWALKHYVSASS